MLHLTVFSSICTVMCGAKKMPNLVSKGEVAAIGALAIIGVPLNQAYELRTKMELLVHAVCAKPTGIFARRCLRIPQNEDQVSFKESPVRPT